MTERLSGKIEKFTMSEKEKVLPFLIYFTAEYFLMNFKDVISTQKRS